MSNDPGVTFVNAVINRGELNGVININFGVLNFTPVQVGQSDDGSAKIAVAGDLVVACRMRMDVECAKQLHESLGLLLATIETASAPSLPVTEPAAMTGKPN